MKSKNDLYLFLGILITLGLIFSSPFIRGDLVQKTMSTVADKDTYVDTTSPTANYGGASQLRCGWKVIGSTGHIMEAFFHFSFSNKPDNLTKAELSLDIWSISATMVLTLSICEASWNEYTLDWFNKPTYGEIIGQIIAPTSDIYKFDLTFEVTARSEISICANITIDDFVDDYVLITSREGYIFSEDAPQIIWTYQEYVPPSSGSQPAIPGYNTILIVGIITIFAIFLKKIIKKGNLNN